MLTLPSLLVIQLRLYASTKVSQMVSNMLFKYEFVESVDLLQIQTIETSLKKAPLQNASEPLGN
jgi:hypothetical protein